MSATWNVPGRVGFGWPFRHRPNCNTRTQLYSDNLATEPCGEPHGNPELLMQSRPVSVRPTGRHPQRDALTILFMAAPSRSPRTAVGTQFVLPVPSPSRGGRAFGVYPQRPTREPEQTAAAGRAVGSGCRRPWPVWLTLLWGWAQSGQEGGNINQEPVGKDLESQVKGSRLHPIPSLPLLRPAHSSRSAPRPSSPRLSLPLPLQSPTLCSPEGTACIAWSGGCYLSRLPPLPAGGSPKARRWAWSPAPPLAPHTQLP